MTNTKITVVRASTQGITQLSVFTFQSLEVKNRRAGGGVSFIKTEASARPRLQDWISWLDPSAARQSFLKVRLAYIQVEVTVTPKHCNMSPVQKVSAACMSSWALSTAWLQLYNWKYSNLDELWELGIYGIPSVQTRACNWRTAFDRDGKSIIVRCHGR